MYWLSGACAAACQCGYGMKRQCGVRGAAAEWRVRRRLPVWI